VLDLLKAGLKNREEKSKNKSRRFWSNAFAFADTLFLSAIKWSSWSL
jgi:hypothetical protein